MSETDIFTDNFWMIFCDEGVFSNKKCSILHATKRDAVVFDMMSLRYLG